jgi:nitroreductase
METIFHDAMSTMLERKSVRHYTGQKVSREAIEKIVRAAMAAPAAVHMLPWKFIVITREQTLNRLSAGLPFAKMLPDAGTAIVVCVEPRKAAMGKEEFAILDGACASENILLAAEALGLGAVWTAIYPNKDLINFVQQELEIPAHIIPLNIIPVGYPTGEDKAQDKFDAASVHWEKWQGAAMST